MRRLTRDEARAIYHQRYVDDPGFATLPDPLRAQVIDDAVLSGPRQAVKDVQRAIGGVTVDGQLGPTTRAALDAADARLVHARLIQARAVRLARIVGDTGPPRPVGLVPARHGCLDGRGPLLEHGCWDAESAVGDFSSLVWRFRRSWGHP